MIVKRTLDSYAKSQKKVWKHDRQKTVGGSEIGQCARKVYYIKSDNKEGEDLTKNYGAAMRGDAVENVFWQPAMKKRFRKKFLFSGKDQTTLVKGNLSATPDGLLVGMPRDFLKDFGIPDMGSTELATECKSIDPRVNISKEKDEHSYQVQVQLGLIRELTEYKPEYALISYVDASFWHEIIEFPVKFDPAIYAAAHGRATQILTATDASELLPEGWIAGGKECDYCPFTKLCNVERKTVPEADNCTDPQFVSEIEDMCREYKQKTQEVDEGEADARKLQEEIKTRLRERGVRRIPGVVSWTSQKGRTSYDNVKLREAAIAAGIDVEQFSTVGEPTDRLTVTVK
jgi:hypothetical protein